MDTTTTTNKRSHSKSELDKFKLFFEFASTEKEVRAVFKQPTSKR